MDKIDVTKKLIITSAQNLFTIYRSRKNKTGRCHRQKEYDILPKYTKVPFSINFDLEKKMIKKPLNKTTIKLRKKQS